MEFSHACPLCLTSSNIPISGKLHKCMNCKAVFNIKFSPALYEEDYFVDMYKGQYGKTYQLDYENIYRLSLSRLESILTLLQKKDLKNISLLDIGSAMGFFLKCAKDIGVGDILGNEISKYASEKSWDNFQIKTIHSSFKDFEPERKFDIISAWYVVEHSESPIDVIRKIYSLLNDKGIMGLAVPSYFGPQYFFNRDNWIDAYPADHRVEFSPSLLKSLLKNTGFHKVYVKPAGFHPERVLSNNSLLYPVFSSLYKIFAKMTAFSDTIEVYAIK